MNYFIIKEASSFDQLDCIATSGGGASAPLLSLGQVSRVQVTPIAFSA